MNLTDLVDGDNPHPTLVQGEGEEDERRRRRRRGEVRAVQVDCVCVVYRCVLGGRAVQVEHHQVDTPCS